jgi:hypothetical protein
MHLQVVFDSLVAGFVLSTAAPLPAVAARFF